VLVLRLVLVAMVLHHQSRVHLLQGQVAVGVVTMPQLLIHLLVVPVELVGAVRAVIPVLTEPMEP
jgi:hypothetical protein